MIAGSFRRAGERACVLLSAVACLVVINDSGGGGAAASVSSVCIDAVRMRLLWLSIICFVLFMQL